LGAIIFVLLGAAIIFFAVPFFLISFLAVGAPDTNDKNYRPGSAFIHGLFVFAVIAIYIFIVMKFLGRLFSGIPFG